MSVRSARSAVKSAKMHKKWMKMRSSFVHKEEILKTTCKKGEMLSIPLSKNLHKKITKRWKKQIGYGTNYSGVTKKKLLVACDKVYGDMPKLKTIAKRWIEANYGK